MSSLRTYCVVSQGGTEPVEREEPPSYLSLRNTQKLPSILDLANNKAVANAKTHMQAFMPILKGLAAAATQMCINWPNCKRPWYQSRQDRAQPEGATMGMHDLAISVAVM